MADTLLSRLVVPVANEDDMDATCQALQPYLSTTIERLVIVHVIEKRKGFPDKAPLEAREEQAERIFTFAGECFQDQAEFETQLQYGPDIVDEILTVVSDIGATAIAFTPQQSNRLTRLLAGDEEHRLITESPCPVIAIPNEEGEGYRQVETD